MVATFRAALVADTGCGLGESPFWDDTTDSLAWVDIATSRLLRLSKVSEVDSSFLPNESTFAASAVGGGIVAAHPLGIDHIDTDGAHQHLVDGWLDPAIARTNDGAVDSRGRIWVGSTTRERAEGSGSIGVISAKAWEQRFGDLTLPNGIGWSPDDRTIYYVDTLSGTIWRADFEPDTAGVGRSTKFFELPRTEGLIDGICVDVDGGIWVAVWGGSCVLRLDPAGVIIARVDVGTPEVTSCAFVGSRLFITSADSSASGVSGAGGLFVVDVGIHGVPVVSASIRV